MNRDLKLDNLRGLAIFLVVLGHFIQETSFSGLFSYQFIYTFIYLFHMPVMIFVSGYLSKIRPDNVSRAFKAVLIPYLIFNTLWIIVAFLQNGHVPSAMYIIPEVGLWYLLSLFFWRSMLPAASKIRYVFWISILLALFVGTINFKTGLLSISRTICFFPVFLLGFYFKDIKEKFTINKYLAAGSFMVLLVGATLFLLPLTTKILFLRDSYHVMGMGNLEGIALRLIVMVVGMVSTILLFNFMTSKETVLTKVGRNSLSVYVLHFYFIFYLPDILNYLGLNFIFHSYLLTAIYVISATVIVTFILSRDVVSKGVDALIKSVTNFLLKEYKLIYTRRST